ncbi:hypothetical protein D1AOALGA4SA_5941 [Olavius algarvensis Delta 1 endosymbiont]|nr:hypothetical protein D1AOALGA4SA_5941 [Olavius algarvensis Delta 1 endosymbiont]
MLGPVDVPAGAVLLALQPESFLRSQFTIAACLALAALDSSLFALKPANFFGRSVPSAAVMFKGDNTQTWRERTQYFTVIILGSLINTIYAFHFLF